MRLAVVVVLLTTLTTAHAARCGAVRDGKAGAKGTFIPVTLNVHHPMSTTSALVKLGHVEADTVDLLRRGGLSVTRVTMPTRVIGQTLHATVGLRVRVPGSSTRAIGETMEHVDALVGRVSERDVTAEIGDAFRVR